MINTYDIAYSLGLAAAAPFWLIKPSARRKVFSALSQRMGHVEPRQGAQTSVMIHAVSLGEVNAARGLIEQLRAGRGDLHIILSTTTQTGFDRAHELYAKPDQKLSITLIRYPLDFTSAVSRILDRLRPGIVVLMELEVWPNFLKQCEKRHIPVVLVNGRMTEPSFRKYRLLGPVVKRMFRRLFAVCAQDPLYAERFAALGVPEGKLSVTGTMKFDTATVADRVAGDAQLADDLGLQPAILPGGAGERIWVCGSTGPGEEEIILRQYRRLLNQHAHLRLVIVPRKPERFDEVAGLIAAAGFDLIRRSQARQAKIAPHGSTLIPPVVLGDTMGELRKFYALADVVFVGRTLVDLGPRQHGSDMIEPAALARPVIVGPFTGNFAEPVNRFREAQAILEVATGEDLGQAASILISSPDRAAEMGRRAQEVVMREKGATQRNLAVVMERLGRPGGDVAVLPEFR